MASSMLFYVKTTCPIYDPINEAFNRCLSGTYVRVTKIFNYNKTTGAYYEIAENAIPDAQMPSEECKRLYVEPGEYYIDKENLEFVQNFAGDYQAAQSVTGTGSITGGNANGYYGPNLKSPIKTTIGNGANVTWDREKGNFVCITSPQVAWVLKSDIQSNVKSSISEYDVGMNASANVTARSYASSSKHTTKYKYTGISEDTSVSLIYPSNNASLTIKGSGVENMNAYSDIKELIKSAGIYDRNEIEWYDKFNRFGFIDPYNCLTHNREYVFFTKPDLHIFKGKDIFGGLNDEISNVPIFDNAYYQYRNVLKQLQWSADKGNPFMNLLSNSIKSPLELPGISADEIETSANIWGTRMTYRKASQASDENFSFNIEFEDSKYLEVYMLFKLFDEYERRKLWGEITPPDMNYIIYKILHDQISIYKFVVGEDGMSLVYWAKLTGCYPTSVPRESFGDMSDGSLKFSTSWKAQFVEDMDPQILTDFNDLITPMYSSSHRDLPIYNEQIQAVDGNWAVTPYIAQRQLTSYNTSEYRYYLKWRI